jgi:thiol-disulfide isomerase/thioredoxin
LAGSILRSYSVEAAANQPVEGWTVRIVLGVCLLAAFAGCKSAPADRPAPTANAKAGQSADPFWSDPNNPNRNPATAAIPSRGGYRADPVSAPGNDPEISGILAGKLVDGFGRAPGVAYVQVSIIRDGRADPIADVETVSQGHFYIRGLQPGRTYKLVARTKQDGRVLVGEAQARPPETKLLIPLGEELAGNGTPPIPSPPAPPQPTGDLKSTNPRPSPPPASFDGSPSAGLGPPGGGAESAGEIAPASGSVIAPRVNVPPPAFQASAACVISSGRIVSLRLPDADGRPWDFAQHRGRLVLFDFWGTWCGPCVRAIPEVARLNTTYSGSGLEVIGVACERGSPAENAGKVRSARQRLNIPYRLVLADAAAGSEVEQQFHVSALPTLILADGDGTILWRGTPEQMRELEGIVRRRLGY